MKYKLIIIITLLLLITTAVKAYTQSPIGSYLIEVSDELVFVMHIEDEDHSILSKTGETFNTSGLYPNDGTVIPLWTIDFIEYKDEIYISNNGKSLIRKSPLIYWGNLEQLAVAFYNNGELVKQYIISEFINNDDLPDSVNHFNWYTKFTVTNEELEILTSANTRIVFDIITGNIIEEEIIETEDVVSIVNTSTNPISPVYLIGVIFLVALAVYIILKKTNIFKR